MPQPHATSFYSEVYNAIKNWAPDGRANVGHTGRYATALNLLRNVAQPQMRVLDVASFGTIVPVLRWVLGFRDITVTGLPMDGVEPHGKLQLPATPDGEIFACAYDRFDIEGPFTYADESFDVVILTEVLEHLTRDPMHTIGELNRITRTGGWLLLSTPNCCSLRSVLKALRGQHPYIWCPYSKHAHRDRHNREYTPDEVRAVLECAGYEVVKLLTRDESYGPRASWARSSLRWLANRAVVLASLTAGRYVGPSLRGESIFALARKTGPVQDRFPEFLYY